MFKPEEADLGVEVLFMTSTILIVFLWDGAGSAVVGAVTFGSATGWVSLFSDVLALVSSQIAHEVQTVQ